MKKMDDDDDDGDCMLPFSSQFLVLCPFFFLN